MLSWIDGRISKELWMLCFMPCGLEYPQYIFGTFKTNFQSKEMEADPTGEEAAEIDLTGAEVVDFSLLKLNLQVNLFNNAFVKLKS